MSWEGRVILLLAMFVGQMGLLPAKAEEPLGVLEEGKMSFLRHRHKR